MTARLPTSGWPAPAKINLFLRVTGRRSDGYHNLQTVFQFLDVADELEFEPLDDGRIELADALPGVEYQDHLCVRAAQALTEYARVAVTNPCPRGVRIGVTKRIPMGAGLGGGSSDAATTLVVLNGLWSLALEPAALAEIGLTLGADVPVFVRGAAAWAQGIGEELRPVRLPQPWYLVVHPGCEVPTAEIFGANELTRNSAPITMPRSLLGEGEVPGIDAVMALGANDCEAAVWRRYPQVREATQWLSQFSPARMTGTGAAVFAPFSDRAAAEDTLERMPTCWWGAVTRGMNDSMLIAHYRRFAGQAAAVELSRK